MPIAVTEPTMLPTEEILRTALAEHDAQEGEAVDRSEVISKAFVALDSPGNIPYYRPGITAPLTVCRFRCMLQDTGYPLEVYMPPAESDGLEGGDSGANNLYGNSVDWSRLKERWVGWGVEIPGEQPWIKAELEGSSTLISGFEGLSVDARSSPVALPTSVHGKFPETSAKGSYTGALLKVYDPETSYQAASTYTFTGILSTSSLPTIDDQDEMDEGESSSTYVPTLHVLSSPYPVYPLQSASIATEADADREEVLDQLSGAFGVDDRLSAEFLLLALISSVTTRVSGGFPLGSLSLNILLPKGPDAADPQAFKRIVNTISTVSPLVSPAELSINLISKGSFYPSMVNAAGSTGLQSGVLQLAPSTVVVMNEDTLEGGDLKDRAVDNLKALMNVFKMQKLRYKYPFVAEDFGMDVDLGLVVVGQGKSFLPVDLHVPILSSQPVPGTKPIDDNRLKAIRRYISEARAAAKSLSIPDDVAEHIQSEFVRLRKKATEEGKTVGEEELKRWMKIARLLALSHPHRVLTKGIWERVLSMDAERLSRLETR
ncbi:hypothetical protein FFLO_01488 [Filobasidium floriforme]|uniref:Mini-chromosome maintenance complex-binding protein n=1 Tax=Filobasidium floriforme TaxID=5210 RepID=A0A8K0NSA6_9TREE|nr:uncharacterized protein HD553DRAFT_304375 [Filobasidium floriforme]KAG7563056.1 hypothetical protein FFLO_01488 [Filobasidium floriforme]KAH8089609.1 hypothetical protein HD553DRAFT_304375 [Filobasidium floriforme]